MITYSLPQKINNFNAEISRWASMRQPYIFKFLRKDATYTGLIAPGGNIAVFNITYLTGSAVYTPQIGDRITIVEDFTTPIKRGTGKIINIIGTVLFTDISQTTSGISGIGYIIFGAFENYKIELTVKGVLPFTNTQIILGTLKATPNKIGICKIDVQQLLTYGCEKINKFNYDVTGSQVNGADYSGYITFSVEYSDVFIYNGLEQTTIRDEAIDGDFWGIDGAKQLLSVYGQNYCDYLPNIATGYPAKFLSCFKRPVLFLGEPYPFSNISPSTYPFSLQTIFRDEWRGTDPYLFTDEILSDGSSAGVDTNALSLNTSTVQHIQIDERRLYSTSTVILNVWLQTQLAGGNIPTPVGYFQDVFPEQKEYPSEVPQFACTEVKQVIVDRRCKQYPIYLMWKNSVGGWDYWLFDKVNETNITSSQGERYDVYVEDIETAQFKNRIIQGSGVKTITVGDVIDVEHIEGLSEIERSASVFMLYDRRKLMSANPELAWIGVQISPKGMKYKSNADKATVEITIVLPEYYTTPN